MTIKRLIYFDILFLCNVKPHWYMFHCASMYALLYFYKLSVFDMKKVVELRGAGGGLIVIVAMRCSCHEN